MGAVVKQADAGQIVIVTDLGEVCVCCMFLKFFSPNVFSDSDLMCFSSPHVAGEMDSDKGLSMFEDHASQQY